MMTRRMLDCEKKIVTLNFTFNIHIYFHNTVPRFTAAKNLIYAI